VPYYEQAILIDTSAVLAIKNPKDKYHTEALEFFNNHNNDFVWVFLNSTAHETYTRARYGINYENAILSFNFLNNNTFVKLLFNKDDEINAIKILKKYKKHKLSFHDALCASIMKRHGIFRSFTFDSDFFLFGFEVFPGQTRNK